MHKMGIYTDNMTYSDDALINITQPNNAITIGVYKLDAKYIQYN